MNEVLPVKAYPEFGLVPTSMPEAMKLAEMMAAARLVPAALQKSPADCLMVIQQAIRWQMDPFAVAQECSVIQGKLMHSGKLVAAVINARGNLAERLSFTYEGDGDNRTITVSGRVSGEAEPRTVTVRLGDARTQNRVWQTQPDQQLMYHGSRVWARRHAPELMLGVYSPEEFDEPAPLRAHSKVPPTPAPNLMLPPHDSDTGEIIEQPASTPPVHPASDNPVAPGPLGAAGPVEPWREYTERWDSILADATDGDELRDMWQSAEQRRVRRNIDWPGTKLDELLWRVSSKIASLKGKVKA